MFRYSILVVALLSVLLGAALATTVTLFPTDDSYVMEADPDHNFGAVSYAFVGSSGGGELWGTLLFDLSSYSGVTVNDASLQLYVDYSVGDFPPSDPYFKIFTGSWNEASITWNNKPPGSYYAFIPDPPMNDWWEIDITYYVQKWVTVWPNYGAFIDAYPSGDNDYFRFRTKEYSGTTYDPRLVLDYSETSIEEVSFGEIKAAFR